jgi:hypothetical protein
MHEDGTKQNQCINVHSASSMEKEFPINLGSKIGDLLAIDNIKAILNLFKND